MATTFHLIRHAPHDLLGKVLVGRAINLGLNLEGRIESARIAMQLPVLSADYSGPLTRARQTARPIAERFGLEVIANAGLDEIDFGEWAGSSFEELDGDPRWARWNRERATAPPAGGESMEEVQERIVSEINRLQQMHEGQQVALVSHGDVIKAGLAYFAGLSLDRLAELDVPPGSVRRLKVDGSWAQGRVPAGSAVSSCRKGT